MKAPRARRQETPATGKPVSAAAKNDVTPSILRASSDRDARSPARDEVLASTDRKSFAPLNASRKQDLLKSVFIETFEDHVANEHRRHGHIAALFQLIGRTLVLFDVSLDEGHFIL